jgi:hypothetical protein
VICQQGHSYEERWPGYALAHQKNPTHLIQATRLEQEAEPSFYANEEKMLMSCAIASIVRGEGRSARSRLSEEPLINDYLWQCGEAISLSLSEPVDSTTILLWRKYSWTNGEWLHGRVRGDGN